MPLLDLIELLTGFFSLAAAALDSMNRWADLRKGKAAREGRPCPLRE